ncbi:hypothetical protein [Primorskyibacter sp. S87]|uniref:hypothetical protein n=1 Tax=Primorskyibacter sp. S87 TaxID=3415126 RepID=UPI003C7B3237
MGAIEESFAELAGEIQERRSCDCALDEICKDFELLMKDLHALPAIRDNGARRLQSDLRDSLEGLKEEILKKLQET